MEWGVYGRCRRPAKCIVCVRCVRAYVFTNVRHKKGSFWKLQGGFCANGFPLFWCLHCPTQRQIGLIYHLRTIFFARCETRDQCMPLDPMMNWPSNRGSVVRVHANINEWPPMEETWLICVMDFHMAFLAESISESPWFWEFLNAFHWIWHLCIQVRKRGILVPIPKATTDWAIDHYI